MSMEIMIVGEGLLADLVFMQLPKQYRVIRQRTLKPIDEQVDLALVLQDGWRPHEHTEAEKLFQASGIPWLRAFVSFGEAVIGPLVRPGVPGCSQCADMRRLMAGRDRKEMWEYQFQLTEEGGTAVDVWSSRTGLWQVCHYVIDEVQRIASRQQARLHEHIQLLDLQTLASSRHFFLADPLCGHCGRLPDDAPELATFTWQPNPKPSSTSYRVKSLDDWKQALRSDYVDARTGFFNGKMRDLVSVFSDVSVNLPLFPHDEATAGRSHSYVHSEGTAILEGLERYCGLTPRGKKTVVYDCYANLGEQALNPVTAGVHSKEQYALPGFPFQPFDPKRPLNWVWGYSCIRERPVLVPERMAYYSLGFGDGTVFETSNGCAIGGSLEEAIFYGIMEVVERDAFLLTWYAQLPLPRLDPHTSGDTELELMIARLQSVTDYELFLYNATMENGIPSVWTIAKNKKQTGLHLVCAGGAHPDPVRAVKGALHETAAMLNTLHDKFEANRAAYLRMYHDSSLVKKMDDHAMLYGLPEAAERLDFLLGNNRPMQSFAEAFSWQGGHTDLTDDLKDILQVFRKLELDVIVIDQTTPEVSRIGLSCVRVLIPGMLPMTFGQHQTRVTNLKRVLHVPVTLGYAKQPLALDQLNPHPHPFP
ncbi:MULTISPECIES: TOMM precursor leader peptide-binding protein [unclassified Brevibacillus]|uniref:TOMM precursor leader peptide-binding protein n=1 Tax=unclassified Brevibacillus TaxID=2684853 RepID=UPI00156A87BE|nr:MULTISPECIES: TOMM precursor leader peptide-binding protein [unclassified Brevibacillus]NRQ52494.1 TOMM precursor leader peptide-binding protein [Brevibacillus sp. HD1.4A]